MHKIICIDKKSKSYELDWDWSRKQNKKFSSLHGLTSYLAMFCPSLPKYFISKYSKPNDVIMDNFCGRGTTGLVARELNRRFIGNDLNPYAYVVSKFKVSQVRLANITNMIKIMEKKYQKSLFPHMQIDEENLVIKELLYFYDLDVLKQLLFLRDNYGKKWTKNSVVINAILATALGLMHGPMHKDNTTIYFSLNMPNTISMSPNYVKKYALKNKLIKPKVNIFEQINKRIKNKYDEILQEPFDGKIFNKDATVENSLIADESVGMVITSPPYLNIVNYTQSNWLRLWLLGYERKSLNKTIKLSDKLNFEQYIAFIKKYLNAIYPKLKNNAKVCLVVGDVFDKKLIETVWKKIKNDVKLKFVEIYYDYEYLQTHKSTNMLNSRSGKATKIDKVMVLKKANKLRND